MLIALVNFSLSQLTVNCMPVGHDCIRFISMSVVFMTSNKALSAAVCAECTTTRWFEGGGYYGEIKATECV